MAEKPLDLEPDIPFYEVHEVVVPHLGRVPITKGDFSRLPRKVQKFIAFYVSSHDLHVYAETVAAEFIWRLLSRVSSALAAHGRLRSSTGTT